MISVITKMPQILHVGLFDIDKILKIIELIIYWRVIANVHTAHVDVGLD